MIITLLPLTNMTSDERVHDTLQQQQVGKKNWHYWPAVVTELNPLHRHHQSYSQL